ncbi:hypothetical protein BE17_17495 [Sorangium cellulosum]|uniref:PLL-like beta propeller domain-containing protein n=1 Tax=Sorangium cellulosum TaxID=56 RepID=A0A150RCG4_SORCE|nr:hypothetical protein BE17_17495 [Sorangium cellulosum]
MIPLRFVQFIDGASDALSTASLNEQIAGANAVFAKAGLRFKLAAPSQADWYDLGGSLAGPPSAVSSSPGHLDIVARGTDGSLLYRSWSSGSWWPSQTAWATLTVDIGGDPIIVSSAPGKLDVFVVGSDATLWHRSRSL